MVSLDRLEPHLTSAPLPSSQETQPSLHRQAYIQDTMMTESTTEVVHLGDRANHVGTEGAASTLAAELRENSEEKEKRNRSSSRGKGRVEKRIEAILPEAQSNSRSRKSSHLLGLFKENSGSHNGRKGQDKGKQVIDRRPSRPSEGEITVQESRKPSASTFEASKDIGSTLTSKSEPRLDCVVGPERSLVLDNNERQNRRFSTQWTNESIDLVPVSNGSTHQDDELTPISTNSFNDSAAYHSVEIKSPEIRPSEEKGERQIQKEEGEKKTNHSNGPNHDKSLAFFGARSDDYDTHCGPCDGKVTSGPSSTSFDDSYGTRRAETRKDSKETDQDCDADSEKEQISSAIYIPHEVHSPDALEDVNTCAQEQSNDSQTRPPMWELRPLSLDESTIESQSGEVDITLQSRNRSRHLHGDMQKAGASFGRFRPSESLEKEIYISPTDSDGQSSDDFVCFANDEDSSYTDELDNTPIATPIEKYSHKRPSERKGRHPIAAPLGVVELKPYNHQVGGHSTVFGMGPKAIAKPLHNRENEFYEVVEREHPELLKFLPRCVLKIANCTLRMKASKLRISQDFPRSLPTIPRIWLVADV